MVTLDTPRALGKDTLLVFIHPDCEPCSALMPELLRWQQEYAATLTIVAISAKGESSRTRNQLYNFDWELLQEQHEVAEAYMAYGTPAAVVVRKDGTIGSHLASGPDAIRALVVAIANRPLQLGEPIPELKLPDLEGTFVEVRHFEGHETMLLFWNPQCGFCQNMLGELKTWESSRVPAAPRLLVISTGIVEENRALGLASPLVIDQNSKYAQMVGANGTPMAVMIDAAGRIASRIVAGSQVLNLAGRKIKAVNYAVR